MNATYTSTPRILDCARGHLAPFFSGKLQLAADVYARAAAARHELVTLTDHDSIGGAEELRQHPDFFISEEVTCTMPADAGPRGRL